MIANYKGNNSAPAWSPDGQYLALALSRDGNTQIYQVSASGGNETRLTQSVGNIIDTEPTMHPMAMPSTSPATVAANRKFTK